MSDENTQPETPPVDNEHVEEGAELFTLPETPPVEHETPLRDDGPTLAEYVAAGYAAENYPPQGYAPRIEPAEPLPRVRQYIPVGGAQVGKYLAAARAGMPDILYASEADIDAFCKG